MADGYPPGDGSLLVTVPVYLSAELITITITEPEELTIIIVESS